MSRSYPSAAKNPLGSQTYGRDGVGMSRQRFQALPGFHVPYPHALVKLRGKEKQTFIVLFLPSPTATGMFLSTGYNICFPSDAADTHRSRHDEVGLGVEVAAEDVVAVTFQRFQALALDQTHTSKKKHSTLVSVGNQS